MMTFNFLWVALTALACHSAAIKVLMLPALLKSHVKHFVTISTALSEAGHEAYVVLPEAYPVPLGMKEGGAKVLIYRSPPREQYSAREEEMRQALTKIGLEYHGDPDRIKALMVPFVAECCDMLLTDEELFRKASDIKADITIVDGAFFYRCFYLFAARLRVPYVTLSTLHDHWHTRSPALPSFVPFIYTGLTDRMTLPERLFNTVFNVKWVNYKPVWSPSEQVTEIYPQDIIEEFHYLITKSALWFYNSDIVMNYPAPRMPKVVDIGGICIQPTKPLPHDLQKFMDDSKEGVIIVSFGSIIPDLPPEINKKFILAFRKLRQSVLWRMSNTQSSNLPENVRTLEWLPQQELLAHPNTKLFITHSGRNGQFEALYNQVPMVGFPLMGDQMFNAKVIEYKGYGKWLDIHTFTSEELTETISSILSNKSFSENLQRASQIFRDRPDSPRTRVVHWLEHVVKYGDAHMRTSAFDLPWYTYLMLDIVAIFLIILILTLLVLCACVCVTLRLCKEMCTTRKVKTM